MGSEEEMAMNMCRYQQVEGKKLKLRMAVNGDQQGQNKRKLHSVRIKDWTMEGEKATDGTGRTNADRKEKGEGTKDDTKWK